MYKFNIMNRKQCICRKNKSVNGILKRCSYRCFNSTIFCKRHFKAKNRLRYDQDIEDFLVKHKKKYKKIFENKIKILRGPGFLNEDSIYNKNDYYTFQNVYSIDSKYFYSFQENNLIYFFDIRSYNILLKYAYIKEFSNIEVQKNEIYIKDIDLTNKNIDIDSKLEIIINKKFSYTVTIVNQNNSKLTISDDIFSSKKIKINSLLINSVINPFSQNIISYSNIKKFLLLANYLDLLDIKLEIFEKLDLDENNKIYHRTFKIFQKMIELNYNIDIDWFLSLSTYRLKRFYSELVNLWYFKSNLTYEQKKNIIFPYTSIFVESVKEIRLIRDRDVLIKIILKNLDKFINSGKTKDEFNTSIIFILKALLVVSPKCAKIYDWLII